MISDGLNGAILAWSDGRVPTDYDVMAQRIDVSGNQLWAVDGITIAGGPGNQLTSVLVPRTSQGAVALWRDTRDGAEDVYAQAIDGLGTPIWTAGGAPLRQATGATSDLVAAPDGSGGAIAAWRDNRNGASDWDLYANHVTGTGGAVDVQPTSFERIRFLPASPNPTASRSRWTLELPAAARVTSRVHDVNGRLVRVVADGEAYPAGRHALEWDGTDANGARVPNGVYFVNTRVADTKATSCVLMLR